MGAEALTRRDDGSEVAVPVSAEDWQLWVSAGKTRNWMLKDPLIDWLQLYGKSRGYLPKQEVCDYNKNLDLTVFLFEKGREFEMGVLRLFQERCQVVRIAYGYADIRCLAKAEETFEQMRQGVPIIYQGVLWDAQNMTYGSPDFLMRSDIIPSLFSESAFVDDAACSAPGLGADGWHYVVVDAKFTTLHLNAAGSELGNGGSGKAYKAQLYVYNRMLGRLQGFEPSRSYLLGRGWERRQGGQSYRGSNALDLLAPVPQGGTLAPGVSIAQDVDEALDWIRRVRTEGEHWQLLPRPSVPELYPNMGSESDDMMVDMDMTDSEAEDNQEPSAAHWVGVKKWLAGEIKELTQVWQVGPGKRTKAHGQGVFRWDDPRLTSEIVGVTSATMGLTLEKVLAANRGRGPLVQPSKIEKTRVEWFTVPTLEFYVDFEYCQDMNDDFLRLPEKGGQPLIFMIGCGHLEEGQWRFKSLVVNELSEAEELRIIQEWINHMEEVRLHIDPSTAKSRIMHWSHAEVTFLENAYNSARSRHGVNASWPGLGWYDFLTNVMRKEPVTVRGALDFGLKTVANAMRAHGLIKTEWPDNQVDGLGAMVGAWRCDEEARAKGVSMAGLPLMRDIARYNEVDCKAMMEIIRYLRNNH